jgi:hypothetical protein
VSALQESLQVFKTAPLSQPLNLLFVYPDPEFSFLTRKILSADGAVFEAGTAREAQTLIQAHTFQIAVICKLGDQPPSHDSLDLIIHLIDQHPDIFIYFFSDLPLEGPFKEYQQGGIINQISTSMDQIKLIQDLAKRIGIKDWKQKLFSFTEPLPPYGKHIFPSEISENFFQNSLPNEVEEISFQNIADEPLFPTFLKQEKREMIPPIEIPKFSNHKLQFQDNFTTSEKQLFFKFSDPTRLINFFTLEIAHKIKNPLVAIKTFTELLKDNFNDQGFREEFYPIVKNEIGKIDQTVESLIEFSEHLDTLTPHSNLLQILENQVKAVNQEGQGKMKISPPLQTLSPFLIDESKASYTFKLLFNAIKENLGGLHDIEIQTEPLLSESPPGGLVITILFPPKNSVSGPLKGLDLILAQWFIESLNGQIKEDTIGTRSVFKVIFYPSLKETTERFFSHSQEPMCDRRQHSFPLAFKDRRNSERRIKWLPISFGDRRGSP